MGNSFTPSSQVLLPKWLTLIRVANMGEGMSEMTQAEKDAFERAVIEFARALDEEDRNRVSIK